MRSLLIKVLLMLIDGKDLKKSEVNKDRVAELIRVKSAKYNLDPKVVAAIVLQESSGRIFASRYEPGFYRRYIGHLDKRDLLGHVPRTITLGTEKVHRSTSWGLMQIMGETARGQDFDKDDMPELCLPENNIEIGCRYLRHLLNLDSNKTLAEAQQTKFFKDYLSKTPPTEPEEETRIKMALLRYNGGGNHKYPSHVISRVKRGEYEKLLGRI